MAAITATDVAAGKIIHADGQETHLFTATTTGTAQTVDLSAYFENIYSVRAWKTTDGVDAEAFCTTAYSNGITLTKNPTACYIYATGTAIRSTGGST